MARRYETRALARDAANAWVASPWRILGNGWRAIEVGWVAASAPDTADGRLDFYLDGAAVDALTGLATGGLRVDEVRLGPSSGAYPSTWGAERFDDFASTPGAMIGP